MLVFAALVPHTPFLIPGIGKENLAKLEATKLAMQELEQEMYQAKPESLIIISPHGELMQDAFTLNLSTEYVSEFKKFGDLTTSQKFKPDVALVYQIKESVETKLSVQMISHKELDYGCGVPLYYLTKNWPEASIVPVGYSFLDKQTHFDFGKAIRHVVEPQNKRVAIVASGDLSHGLDKKNTSQSAKEFDAKIIDLLKNKQSEKVVGLEQNLIDESGECGLKSLLILLGVLSELNWQVDILAYQKPFGVGYLTANFELNR